MYTQININLKQFKNGFSPTSVASADRNMIETAATVDTPVQRFSAGDLFTRIFTSHSPHSLHVRLNSYEPILLYSLLFPLPSFVMAARCSWLSVAIPVLWNKRRCATELFRLLSI